MAVIAVAGGTGDVGRTIVKALAGAGRHTVFVLSRTAAADKADNVEAERLAVEYDDVEQMSYVLKQHKVEVVIATLLLSVEAVAQSQMALIRAAARSGTVKKFIPTEFHLDYNIEIPGLDDPFAKFHRQCEQELGRHPQLTHTLIRIGLFLDYLAMPYDPVPTSLRPYYAFVDLAHEVCVIPGDGTNPVIFSHSRDVAALIERLVDLPAQRWPRESFVQGNRIQAKDLVGLVNAISGRKFKVVWESPEAIRQDKITLLPSNKSVFEDAGIGEVLREIENKVFLTVLGDGYAMHGQDLAELFPDVEITKIEPFLREAWKIKEARESEDRGN